MKSGKVDALCADGPWTRSAIPYVDYTHPYMFIPGYIYVAEKNPRALTIQKMNSPDVTFTTIDGDGSSDIIEMLFPKVKLLSLPSTADPNLLIENVTSGKADAMWNDPASVEAQSANNKKRVKALNPEKPIATFPFALSLPKEEQDLMNTLNQGIDLLNDTGKIEQILQHYDPAGKKLRQPQARYK